MSTFLDGFGVDVSALFGCFVLASFQISLAGESSRRRSDTLEFDDPYEGFATFLHLQKDVTAKRTCRKTYEFRLRMRSAN